MKEAEFRSFLEGRRIPSDKVELSLAAARDLEVFLVGRGSSWETAGVGLLDEHISGLIADRRNTEERLVALARYSYMTRRNDLYIHIAGLVNAVEVLPEMERRLGELAGEDVRREAFEGVVLPPLGAPQSEYHGITRTVVSRMEASLPGEKCREILTWNYHGIPLEAFSEKARRYQRAEDLDEFLRDEHRRFVEEISGFMREGRVWYEQEITPEVVVFVERDQEISVGRREGDAIYVTKIPFDTRRYLEEDDPRRKRYWACHCPLARESILEGAEVPPLFCHCSAGFTKLPYDVIFGEDVEIEMLESALKGDLRCRFAVRIPAGKSKGRRQS